jgi:hypothetical protein
MVPLSDCLKPRLSTPMSSASAAARKVVFLLLAVPDASEAKIATAAPIPSIGKRPKMTSMGPP